MTTRCVVLQTHRYSDTSKILRLMTEEHGPRSTIARGALRPKSRISGLTEPFVEGRATIYLKENRDLHALSDFELIRERQALGRDLRRFAGASVLCELVLRLAPEQADAHLYRVLVDGLDELIDAPDERAGTSALQQIWRLVATLGFEPSLDVCVACGSPPEPDAGARFDHAAGGVRCRACPPIGTELAAHELAALRALIRGPDSPSVTRKQVTLVADFIRYHAAEDLQLKSLDFLTSL